MIFKGHLTGFFPQGAFSRFLSRQNVLLKDFDHYVQSATNSLKKHAKSLAEKEGRPFIYLQSATTKAQGYSKEDLAKAIAKRDKVDQGLICVFSVLETRYSFAIRGNRKTQKLETFRKKRRCLHFYFYLIDPEFGLMHIRLQSWFPFEMQIYINGREWLGRQLDQHGIGYKRYENSFVRIDDLKTAQQLCERFEHRDWPRTLNAFALQVNPMLTVIEQARFKGYYWCTDQGEYATDIMFRNRASLKTILPDLFEHATLKLSAENVMQFLGRKLHGNFKGEVITDLKNRPKGWRVKHAMKRNSVKMYDKWSILRIETTINKPSEFKILRRTGNSENSKLRWMPMGKGVVNIWRYSQVSKQANFRYLDALVEAQLKGEGIKKLDDLCRSHCRNGKRYAKFNPVAKEDCILFAAAMAGEHIINGFRNRDLCQRLYTKTAANSREAKKRCARVSRLIAKLRGHNLISKVKNSFLYRVTSYGYKVMAAALSFRQIEFPTKVSCHV